MQMIPAINQIKQKFLNLSFSERAFLSVFSFLFIFSALGLLFTYIDKNSGIIPAVFYGPKESSQSIQIVYADFEKVFKEAGESAVVVLVLEGQELQTLIHDVAYHPVKGTFSHLVFFQKVKHFLHHGNPYYY
jgi:ribosomal protein L25 (general stress protein Ctc)